MILVSIFPGIDGSIVIPLQLVQDDRSPLFGSLRGDLSSSLLSLSLAPRSCVGVWISAFSVCGGMPSGLAALPDFSDFMALAISYLARGVGAYSKQFSRWWDV